MAGGKISGLHVRATAPAPANAGATEPQQTPEPQQPGGRRVARSAELEGLAALPSPQAPASPVSAGQMRRAPLPLPAPAAEVPLEPLPAPAAEAPLDAAAIAEKKAVETALKRGSIWEKLGGGAEMTAVKQLKLARDGLVSAKAGVAALDQLTKHAVVDEADEARAQLMGYLAMAAISGIETYKRVLKAAWKLECPQPRHASAQRERVSGPAFLRQQAGLDDMAAIFDELKGYRGALDDYMRLCQAPSTPSETRVSMEAILPAVVSSRAIQNEAVRLASAVVVADSSGRLSRLAKHVTWPEFQQRVGELKAAASHGGEALSEAIGYLEVAADEGVLHMGGALTQHLTPEKLAECKATAVEYGEGLHRVGVRLCLDAAARLEMDDTSDLWRAMLDVAHGISAYRTCLQVLCDSVSTGKAPSRARSKTKGQAASPAQEPSSARLAEAPGASRKPRGKGNRSAGSTSAAGKASAARDRRTGAQKHADTVLNGFPVDLKTARQLSGDIDQIAAALDQDVGEIEAARRNPRYNAVQAADAIRGLARKWFGEAERLSEAQTSLPRTDARNGQLADRLQALELIHQRLDIQEADEIKRDALPWDQHLERLLQRGEIAHVSAPIRLPSEGDIGPQGTLFEMRIQPKPCSNEEPVAPWFLHLHTSELASAEGLHTLESDKFKAVHMKTSQEKNLGRTWEMLMRARGRFDAKVHRAPIGHALRDELFARVQVESASGRAVADPARAH
ncbi:type III secretion system effector XopP [Ralstonia solanacearum]|uniref:type III secretion system effector XopP n=1 Tax=Ralstonia solanacearum TaxID=305 RepID=UPI0009E660B5|nr:type III secretion system effector XopP [Ralstonia solanacearum]AXV88174.1 type III effector protein (hlk2) [Ralstonia solanacearum]AXW07659.1 type III effector protein (hlk2) [Ralstonia solanacearum]AXW25449.1 type III effector protein (hlk2) [Ralstonia solanacearum]AXW82361.1 type III effector protein (hlk2) [Ralstonia solanacearum]